MSRYVFARDRTSPVLTGIAPEDLINWRAAPDLVPEGRNQPSDVRHAPKWTNTHAVASFSLDIPQVAGFTPLLATEFDLASSPLLEWRHGKGRVLLSTLDFTGRVGTDPAATRLAGNLLTYAATPVPAARQVLYAGGETGRALVTRLCGPADSATAEAPPAETLLVLGDDAPEYTRERFAAFIKAGGHVLSLPKSADSLAKLGFKTEARTLSRVPETEHPLFHAIGPNLLRWREPAPVTLFAESGQPANVQVVAGGAAAVWTDGSGTAVFLQLGPDMFAATTAPAPDKSREENLQLSRIRLAQLTAQLLTNLGAPVPAALAERLMILDMGPAYELLSTWNVLGPFFVAKEDGNSMLNTRFPGEETAIAGDDNPNSVFTTPDGRRLDWRWTVTASEGNGFIDIGKALKRSELAVAYVMRRFTSDSEREAVLRFGADWRAMIWVNGEPVFRTLAGGNNPLAHQVRIKLRRGENVIAMKIGAGSKGFGFYASLSLPIPAGQGVPPALKQVSPYFLDAGFDPYQYFYW
jgi:beta-galactosidase